MVLDESVWELGAERRSEWAKVEGAAGGLEASYGRSRYASAFELGSPIGAVEVSCS